MHKLNIVAAIPNLKGGSAEPSQAKASTPRRSQTTDYQKSNRPRRTNAAASRTNAATNATG